LHHLEQGLVKRDLARYLLEELGELPAAGGEIAMGVHQGDEGGEGEGQGGFEERILLDGGGRVGTGGIARAAGAEIGEKDIFHGVNLGPYYHCEKAECKALSAWKERIYRAKAINKMLKKPIPMWIKEW
jgi:hypothetical protein